MIKTLITFGIVLFLTVPIYASTGIFEGTSSIALLIAAAALALSVVNFFRIKRVHRIHEVDFMNQKEDVTLTLERFKSSLTQDNRNPRKEFPRHSNAPKNTPNKPVIKPTIAVVPAVAIKDSVTEVTTDVPKTAKPKKKYYHRRKPGASGERSSSLKE
ncbi:MAG: hypothetical protein WCX31_09450 [Salinivirgaceae bacterium]|jgi:hypothetical protein